MVAVPPRLRGDDQAEFELVATAPRVWDVVQDTGGPGNLVRDLYDNLVLRTEGHTGSSSARASPYVHESARQ